MNDRGRPAHLLRGLQAQLAMSDEMAQRGRWQDAFMSLRTAAESVLRAQALPEQVYLERLAEAAELIAARLGRLGQ